MWAELMNEHISIYLAEVRGPQGETIADPSCSPDRASSFAHAGAFLVESLARAILGFQHMQRDAYPHTKKVPVLCATPSKETEIAEEGRTRTHAWFSLA